MKSSSQWVVLLVFLWGMPSVCRADEAGRTESKFAEAAVPFLQAYCLDCHSSDSPEAGVDLESLKAVTPENAEVWKSVWEQVALKAMPPLLRSYLTMGGWVSDHAVVDRELDTLNVFTGLEIATIPEARARSIRASAL